MVWFHLLVAVTALAGSDQPAAQALKEQAAGPVAPVKPRPAAPAAQKAPPGSSSAAAKTAPNKKRAPNPRSRNAGADADVRIRSIDEMRKSKNPFLLSPDAQADRYNPEGPVDWSAIPPWRQTSFFGVRARGAFFVYVVDCSGSMIDDDRLPRATIELRRSVFALREPQRFEVIFYNSEAIPMPGGPIPRTADLEAKNQLRAFLRLIGPDGGTDPRPAMRQALSLRPDAVFLLSDGAFPDGTVAEITRLNKRKVPIHCIDLTAGSAGDQLRQIAQANSGIYAARPGDLQGRP